MGERNIIIVKQMIQRAEKILIYCKGLDRDSFLSNEEIIELCAFNFMQIGEMVSALDDEFIEQHPSVPWFKMRGLRHRIVHDYIGVDFHIVWEIITDNLPDLIRSLNKIL